ncbi:hypothetical protein HK102_012840, partial [Quaeritorhiza haematococci]
MAENEGLYTVLTYREEQDKQIGYNKDTNKVMEYIEILERDLLRTFPENYKFRTPVKPSPQQNPSQPPQPSQTTHEPKINISEQSIYVQSLRNVLVAFAYYSWPHPDPSRAPPRTCTYNIGYCQSLNFIVGLLLLIFAHNTQFENTHLHNGGGDEASSDPASESAAADEHAIRAIRAE